MRFNLRLGKEVEACVVLRCANTTYGAEAYVVTILMACL